MTLKELCGQLDELEFLIERAATGRDFAIQIKTLTCEVEALSLSTHRTRLAARLARLRERQAAWLMKHHPRTSHLDSNRIFSPAGLFQCSVRINDESG